MGLKALVTGASGVVGANLVRALLEAGWEVRVLLRPGPPRRALVGLPIAVREGDVLDARSVSEACAGVDVVFHAAARFTYREAGATELDRVAVDGTRIVLESAAAAGVGRVVLTSSSVIFGSSATPEVRNESSPPTDVDATAYARSKVRQTTAALATARAAGIDLVVACPTLTIGPWDFRVSESNGAIVKYLNDPFRSTFAGGCNVVAAQDVARGHVLLAERGASGEAYLLGGEDFHWNALHAEISRLCATYGPLVTATHTAAYLTAAWNEVMARTTGATPALTRDEVKMMGRWYWYDDARARSLGYRSRPGSVALREALDWLLRTEHVRADVRAAIGLASSARDAAAAMMAP